MRREIDLMLRIRHPNCVELYETYENKTSYYIVMERVTGGHLLERIIGQESYTETQAAHVFVQLIKAIDYLHSIGIGACKQCLW